MASNKMRCNSITMDMELCVNSMKIAEVVQLPHHIIAGAIEVKCLHTARNSQIEN